MRLLCKIPFQGAEITMSDEARILHHTGESSCQCAEAPDDLGDEPKAK
jgi:hypothetical protein